MQARTTPFMLIGVVVGVLLLGAAVAALLGRSSDSDDLPGDPGRNDSSDTARTRVPSTSSPSVSTGAFDCDDPDAEDEYALVTRVVDGDTVHITLNGEEDTVRYVGIDTPELRYEEPYADEARERNIELVEGQCVRLERDVNDRDEFGRLLRYIWLEDGRMVNKVIIGEGLAWAVLFGEDARYLDSDLLPAEAGAIRDRLGVWSTVRDEPPACFEDGEDRCNCGDFVRHQDAQYFHVVFDPDNTNRLYRGEHELACGGNTDRVDVRAS